MSITRVENESDVSNNNPGILQSQGWGIKNSLAIMDLEHSTQVRTEWNVRNNRSFISQSAVEE
jgi:hypothetical protein